MKKIVVTGLAPGTSNSALRKAFKDLGKLSEVNAEEGYVVFESAEAAAAALAAAQAGRVRVANKPLQVLNQDAAQALRDQEEAAARQAQEAAREAARWAEKPAARAATTAERPPVHESFHNPYNFVPTPPRPRAAAFAGDADPVVAGLGHDQLGERLWTGRIPVRMTVVTPLLLPESKERETSGKDHKTYDMRQDLPLSGVRGLLRSAYEIATNSRYGGLSPHTDALALRMAPRGALELVPARVERDPDAPDKFVLRLMPGASSIRPAGPAPAYAAYLQRYAKYDRRSPVEPDKGEAHEAVRYPDGRAPVHGERLWFRTSQHKASSIFHQVAEIAPYDAGRPGSDWQDGYACVTGRNIMNKRSERVFFDRSSKPIRFPLGDELRDQYANLVRDYKAVHEKEYKQRKSRNQGMDEYTGHDPGQTGFSRHVWNDDEEWLQEGSLVFARLSYRGGPDGVKSLFPVMISRELYPASPIELLDATLRPAVTAAELSPAERLFGWVAPVKQQEKNGQAAYRGRVMLDNASVAPPAGATGHVQTFDRPLALAILGEPKPSQARFYVARDAQGKASPPGGAKQDVGYEQGRGLRGRKVYPHHRGLEFTEAQGYWSERDPGGKPRVAHGRYQEFLRPEQDDQNRSVTGWIRPGTTYSFDLCLTNLQDEELGGLLWLLTQPEARHYRFGLGRPLGFGSVRLMLGAGPGDALPMGRGRDWREYYSRLDAEPPRALDPQARDVAVTAFASAMSAAYGQGAPAEDQAAPAHGWQAKLAGMRQGAVEVAIPAAGPRQDFEALPFIQAFLVAMEGFADGLPVHYPRLRPAPDPEGKNYEWFVQNEAGYKLPLPDLTEERGLVYQSRPAGGRR